MTGSHKIIRRFAYGVKSSKGMLTDAGFSRGEREKNNKLR